MDLKNYKPGIGFIVYEFFAIGSMLSAIKDEGIFFAVFGIIFYTSIGFAFSYNSWKKKMNLENMTLEEKNAYLLREQEKKDKREKELATAREVQKKKKTIVSVQILDINHNYKTKGSLTSAAVRGAVGGLVTLGNPIGVVAGVATHKKKTVSKGSTTRFLIEYEDGHKVTKEVKVDSSEYNKLIQYL
ncbi:MAG: hypothetical protein IKM20_08085 [Erysipelotrichales bacterium]|nr:hypothetical protein [Erysipelotrichales bacterium]